MTIELTDQEIEEIAFAHSKLQLEKMFNNRLTGKPKQHLMQYTTALGFLLDRIEKQQKETRIIGTARAE
jgi:hypothetical protein